jgi:hypothetical protein
MNTSVVSLRLIKNHQLTRFIRDGNERNLQLRLPAALASHVAGRRCWERCVFDCLNELRIL